MSQGKWTMDAGAMDDDVTLMRRARDEDDRTAFAELIRRHQRPLMNFFARSGVYGDIEDLTQETFLRLHRYRTRYAPKAKFTTFLYLLARQVRIDALRHSQRRDGLHRRAAEDAPQTASPSAAGRGVRLDAESALAALSEPMREVVVLALLQGFTHTEVSEVLKIPVGTVKSRLSAALQRMREYMEGNTP